MTSDSYALWDEDWRQKVLSILDEPPSLHRQTSLTYQAEHLMVQYARLAFKDHLKMVDPKPDRDVRVKQLMKCFTRVEVLRRCAKSSESLYDVLLQICVELESDTD